MTTYNRVHKHTVTGIDAYEDAWDFASAILWRMVGFNLVWLGFFLSGWIAIKVVLYALGADWFAFLTINLFYALLFLGLWELANVVKFRFQRTLSLIGAFNFLCARSAYLAILLCGYLLLILPGIYIHSRLLLHTPLAARNPESKSFSAIGESWRLTSGRVITLYALWIVTVLSKPACALPVGLGFILERPLSGFAKDILLANFESQAQSDVAGTSVQDQ